MRRLLTVFAATCFLASLAGCHSTCGNGTCGRGGCGGALRDGSCHNRGICDCEEDDHCLERAPWLRMGSGPAGPIAAPIVPGEPIPPPSKTPDAKPR